MRRKEGNLRIALTVALALLSGCNADPGRPTGVMYSRQTAAIFSLSQVRIQQELAREKRIVDQDKDGIPEFCLLGELAGELIPRGSWRKMPLIEPFLPSGYKTGGANGKGFAERNGYYFRIYLAANPDQAGDDKTLGGTDTQPGPQVSPQAVDMQEKDFALYAWPTWEGTIPKYAVVFFINEKGITYLQKGTKYIGEENAPSAEAAYSGHVFTSEIDTSRWQSLYGGPKRAEGR